MAEVLANPPAPGQTTDALLEVRDVYKEYTVSSGFFGTTKQQLRALDGVSLRVTQGTTLGVVGESGCGKSTLAKAVVMLEPPTRGNVYYQGTDIYTLQGEALKDYRRQVQFIFQDPYSSLPVRMSVGTILTEPLAIHNIGTPAQRAERASQLLALVGLDQKDLKRYPHMFSGGQRQRICVARALALEPRLLICDEPVSALDVSIQAQILRLLTDLQNQLRLTYVIISHDLRVIKYMCDQLAVMYLGRVVETGDSAAIYRAPLHPYASALLRSIPSHGDIGRRGSRFSFLQGEVPSPLRAPSGCHFHPRCPLRARLSDIEAKQCDTEAPALRVIAPGHASACHFAEKMA